LDFVQTKRIVRGTLFENLWQFVGHLSYLNLNFSFKPEGQFWRWALLGPVFGFLGEPSSLARLRFRPPRVV
jgi:hypothetical protein